MSRLSLDIIIPCYNASTTLQRAVTSAVQQNASQWIYLVDDASTDNTWLIMRQLQQQFPHKIKLLRLAENSGVATARNWGALHSQADLIAFLDADDAYQAHALAPVPDVFHFLPELSLLRLRLVPVDLDKIYAEHSLFAKAWDIVQMTVGGNTIFRRSIFLACGGFPQHDLFKRLGGEDGALGIALAERTAVGTLFDEHHAGVLHFCRKGMHAERLLRAYLFHENDPRIHQHDMQMANQVTAQIVQQLNSSQVILQHQTVGRRPILIEYAPSSH